MKKRIAILLSVLMVITPGTTVFGAEFSSGESETGISTEAEGSFFSSDPEDVYVVPETEPSAFEVQEPEVQVPEIPEQEIPDTEVGDPAGSQQDDFDEDILKDDPEEMDSMGNDSDNLFDAEDMDIFQVGEEGTDTEDPDSEKTDDNQEEEPQEKISIETFKVTISASATYTGKAITPKVSISNDNQTLVKDQDYTLEYSNNTEIGIATVKITGTGDYEGTVEKNFKILPAAPKLKSASSAGYNSVKLTWNAVPGAESYIIYYKGDTIKSWKKIKSGVKGNSYVHTSLSKFPLVTGKKYTYTVKAVKGSYISSYDKTGKSATPIPAAAKLGKVQSSAYNKLKITWSKVPGASGYYIYRKSGSSWKKVGTSTSTSFVHKSSAKYPIVTGTTYTYTVKAYRKVGSSTVAGTYNKTGINGKAVPNKPTLVSLEYGDAVGKIKINWKKASGATNYLIYRKDSNGKWQQIANVKGANTLNYTHVSSSKYPIVAGKNYTYTVRSYTTVGKTKGLYDTKGKTIKGPSASDLLDANLSKKTQSILSAITTTNMTNSQKLYAAWKYVTSSSNFKYWPKYPDLNKTGWQKECALDMLTTGRGNCYSFACAFAALASEIGYSPSVVCGRVSGNRDGASDGLTRHCWVRINGAYYDPEAQYAGWYSGVYGSGSYDINHTVQKTVPFK